MSEAAPLTHSETMTHEFVEAHTDVVNMMARRHHKQSTLFTVDDVAQEIWLHMAKNWFHVRDQTPYKIEGYAHRAAAQYCRDQRIEHMYSTGAFLYTPEDVKHILATSTWVDPSHVTDVAGRVDVQAAFRKLPPMQKDAVFSYFALGESEGLPQAVRKNVSRGVDRICHLLNTGAQLRPTSLEDVEA